MEKTSDENSLNQHFPVRSYEIVEKSAVEDVQKRCVINAHYIPGLTNLKILQIGVSSLHSQIV